MGTRLYHWNKCNMIMSLEQCYKERLFIQSLHIKETCTKFLINSINKLCKEIYFLFDLLTKSNIDQREILIFISNLNYNILKGDGGFISTIKVFNLCSLHETAKRHVLHN